MSPARSTPLLSLQDLRVGFRMGQGVVTEAVKGVEPYTATQLIGRMGRPEEIASTIAYLCSHLAGYISGNWIVVDGGKHASAF